MSAFIFPDKDNTQWIAWKKVKQKSKGVGYSKTKCVPERILDSPVGLPSLNVSPLNLSQKPLKSVKHSYPKEFDSKLVTQLPPFSRSLKSRYKSSVLSNHDQNETWLAKNVKSERAYHNILLIKNKKEPKKESIKRIKRSYKKLDIIKPKLEGIVGTNFFNTCDKSGFEDSNLNGKTFRHKFSV